MPLAFLPSVQVDTSIRDIFLLKTLYYLRLPIQNRLPRVVSVPRSLALSAPGGQRRPPRSRRGRDLSPVLGFCRARPSPETPPLPPSPSVLASSSGRSFCSPGLPFLVSPSPHPALGEVTWASLVTPNGLRYQIHFHWKVGGHLIRSPSF